MEKKREQRCGCRCMDFQQSPSGNYFCTHGPKILRVLEDAICVYKTEASLTSADILDKYHQPFSESIGPLSSRELRALDYSTRSEAPYRLLRVQHLKKSKIRHQTAPHPHLKRIGEGLSLWDATENLMSVERFKHSIPRTVQ